MSFKITVFMITCREDYPIIGLKDLHIFSPLIDSLNYQNFRDFELIIVDSLHEWRDTSPINEANFKVTHIPPKPSPWLKIGFFHECNSINTAILHSKGILMVKVDDCMEFDEDYLEEIWKHYKNGYLALPTFTYIHENAQAYYSETLINELSKKGNYSEEEIKILKHGWSVYEEGEPIRDTRFKLTNKQKDVVTSDWYYGVSALPLKDALEVNGEDENFDGSKGLVDVDLGSRLEMNGCYPFLYDKSLIVREHLNEGLSQRIIKDYRPYWKSNLALYQLNKKYNRIRANNHRLSNKDIKYVMKETKPEFYDEELFKFWIENQRTFNLDKMRDELK